MVLSNAEIFAPGLNDERLLLSFMWDNFSRIRIKAGIWTVFFKIGYEIYIETGKLNQSGSRLAFNQIFVNVTQRKP